MIDLPPAARAAYDTAYAELAKSAPGVKLLLTTYFGGLRENIDLALSLPVAGLHVDLVRAPDQLATLLSEAPPDLVLSLGIVDGRNVWRSDLRRLATIVQQAVDKIGSHRVLVAPSSSLMHTPVDLELETGLDDELKGWLAFARQKLGELVALASFASGGDGQATDALASATMALEERKLSERIHVRAVAERVAGVTEAMARRPTPFAERKPLQQIRLGLPPLPTTTIGSFPQTPQIRRARAAFKEGRAAEAEYTGFLKQEIARVIAFQEDVGLDVLVHGEPERSDMVEYFAERLEGMAITSNGWVQSYGSRCVRPPVIYGDVYRPHPMTVEWAGYAQSLTVQPVKGMLTGPITILQWSFVRDDQPRSDTCRQIALAIRDEVTDLEAAGIRVIQIDEPALREGLPLRQQDWSEYLEWAVECFRLTAGGVQDDTQIHTHMCYAEFNDIIDAIAAMDADVISIESSRSHMDLLDAFGQFHYPNDIGPGVYDIHSPRVPLPAEMLALLERATAAIPPDKLWVNPDCGLKTRRWEEVEPALRNLVAAAQQLRRRLHVTP